MSTGTAAVLAMAAASAYLQCVTASQRPGVRLCASLLAALVALSGLFVLLASSMRAAPSAVWSMPASSALAFLLIGIVLLAAQSDFSTPAKPPGVMAENSSHLEPADEFGIERLRHMVGQVEGLREQDKKAIARELHDDVGALLTSLTMHLQGVYPKLPAEEPWIERKEKIQGLLQSLVKITRRMQSQLHPAMLELFGLKAALNEHLEDFSEQTGIRCQADFPDEEMVVERTLQMTLYRILQEYLNQVIRNSQTASVDVILDVDDEFIALTIRDDDRHCNVESRAGHAILKTLADRVAFLGGALVLRSGDHGNMLNIKIPLPAQASS